ncbi:hypothetical protein EON65_51190 [archaeon]|nr:MAG: hypothetical protein EON65_51190 [archaeon]
MGILLARFEEGRACSCEEKISGGSVKVWVGFRYNHKCATGIYSGAFASKGYKEILNDNLLPLYCDLSHHSEDEFLFHEGNDPRHTSEESTTWKEVKEISPLTWPACSPDLAPAEISLEYWHEMSTRRVWPIVLPGTHCRYQGRLK